MSNEQTSSDVSPSVLDRVVAWIKAAGAASETDSARDGFLSYHAESHALGLGLAAGWFFVATGQTQLLSIIYAAAVYGRARTVNGGARRRVLADVTQEWHYALGGVVAGAVLATLLALVRTLL
ncbi:hypothetical protein J2752_000437 [Halarchaeum rubridurum]|uniref:Uncharacterized protein n=1 Tax=Halarchaeum rubridurum TaxID=489911 RepID=A0A830FMD0_9EURY|nr:hypothetical protein [Halarchaeum rubridurum]MBP1953556.1 hypothetical protein [Halarchaeum rubridurum]GGM64397.1 hypothetical protein GCM10009017_13040 [Halarchaeum rubridurum]